MKAVYFEEHGPIEVLRYSDFPDPAVTHGWVKLRVLACSLNYLDVFSRRGMPGITIELPSITGGDCVGEVVETGEGVDEWTEGQRVLVDPVWTDPETGRFQMLGENRRGAMAEYCVVHHSQLINLPDSVDSINGACLPVAYGTAYRMMYTRGNIKAGESVLILGASGGVGTACVMLAKAKGARVVAAAGTDDKCRRLIEIGADETINYSTTNIREYTKKATGGGLFTGGGWDVVVNFTGGDTWADSLKCASLGGRILTCGATAGFDPPTDLRYIWTGELNILGSNGWQREDLVDLVALVERGELKPVVDSVADLAGAIDACRRLEERDFFGKLVVTP